MCRAIDQGGRRCPGGSHSRLSPTPAPRMANAATMTRPASTHRAVSEAEAANRVEPSYEALMDAQEQAERDEWRAQHGPETPQEKELRSTVASLTAGPGAWVGLDRLRAALPGRSRAEVDAVIRGLLSDPDVAVTPDSDLRRMTPAQRDAAIRIGGEDRHLIQIRNP